MAGGGSSAMLRRAFPRHPDERCTPSAIVFAVPCHEHGYVDFLGGFPTTLVTQPLGEAFPGRDDRRDRLESCCACQASGVGTQGSLGEGTADFWTAACRSGVSCGQRAGRTARQPSPGGCSRPRGTGGGLARRHAGNEGAGPRSRAGSYERGARRRRGGIGAAGAMGIAAVRADRSCGYSSRIGHGYYRRRSPSWR